MSMSFNKRFGYSFQLIASNSGVELNISTGGLIWRGMTSGTSLFGSGGAIGGGGISIRVWTGLSGGVWDIWCCIGGCIGGWTSKGTWGGKWLKNGRSGIAWWCIGCCGCSEFEMICRWGGGGRGGGRLPNGWFLALAAPLLIPRGAICDWAMLCYGGEWSGKDVMDWQVPLLCPVLLHKKIN